LELFNTIFTGILIQTFPFVIIGVLVSSFMHVFVEDEWIVKIFPKKYGLGFITALFAGLFFPVCECAIVPVMTRLVKKGVPMPIAITFMLSAPIINPIVILSTLYAFPGQPEITFMRVGFGLLIALLIGGAMTIYGSSLSILLEDHCEEHCSCHIHGGSDIVQKGLAGKFRRLFLHAGDEFFDVGKYLVIGAFLTSLMQTLIPREAFLSIGSRNGLSMLLMMLLAFVFSACSTSDAFIANSFANRVAMGPIMGFLVFGPMMDLKNLLMLLANFEKAFVIRLSVLIVVLNFLVLSLLTAVLL
jgi:uncharacterized membrane protein YraQ (UPF0718 family)